MRTFVEELLILITEGESTGRAYIPDRTQRHALAGAVLLELALNRRIDTDVEALSVTDPTPLGDELLDPTLSEIAQDTETRTAEFWVRRLADRRGEELREMAKTRLLEAGILEADDGGVLFLSPRIARLWRYPSRLALTGDSGKMLFTRLRDILYSDAIPSPTDCAMISLARACGLFRQLLDRDEFEELDERIALIARLDLVGRTVIDAISQLSLAESQVVTRVLREQGGGWPRASGRLPLVGHAFKLNGDLRAFFTEQYRKLGPVFEVNAPGRNIVVMAGQEANLFVNREGKTHLRSRELTLDLGRDLGAAKILIGLDGPDHLRLRRAKRRGYSRDIILEQMSDAVAVAERELFRCLGQPVAGFDFVQRITTEQITAISVGASALEYLEDIITFTKMMLEVYFLQRLPKILVRMPRFKRARRRMEELFDKVLASHETDLRGEARGNVLDELLELRRTAPDFMPDTDLFINVMGPFLVGIDSVSASTAFLLYTLLKHPELTGQARVEADALFANGGPNVEKLQQMTVTKRAVLETLRMYPAVPGIFRTVTNTFDFGGYRIPAGTSLIVALTVPHYLPEFFPDPERFDIDRYLPERGEHLQSGAYAPFGLGQHSCLGQGFSQVQMALTIATLLHHADIALTPPGYRVQIQQTPTPRPKRSFKLQMQRRRQEQSS